MIGCSFDAMEKVSSHFTEIAALPWRIGSEGTLEILLHSPQEIFGLFLTRPIRAPRLKCTRPKALHSAMPA